MRDGYLRGKGWEDRHPDLRGEDHTEALRRSRRRQGWRVPRRDPRTTRVPRAVPRCSSWACPMSAAETTTELENALTHEDAHMKIGRLGVWAQADCLTASAEAEFAREVEQWGYSALWTPEAMGRDVLVNSAWLLANTRKLVIAS